MYLSPVHLKPQIHRAHYDFDFDSMRSQIDERVDAAASLMREDTLERDGGITTVVHCLEDPPHNWKMFDEFKLWLYDRIDEVWEDYQLQPMMRQISESWINKHPPGAWTSEHHHQCIQVAVAVYLNVPENSGRFLVKDPTEVYKRQEPLDYHYYERGGEWEPIEITSGDILFFPGWMYHKTEVNKSKEDRYVMSLNIRGAHQYHD